jgi:hypothetical protein
MAKGLAKVTKSKNLDTLLSDGSKIEGEGDGEDPLHKQREINDKWDYVVWRAELDKEIAARKRK